MMNKMDPKTALEMVEAAALRRHFYEFHNLGDLPDRLSLNGLRVLHDELSRAHDENHVTFLSPK